MNVVEAFIKFRGQLLILISGLPECGKLTLAKNISRDFKIKLINQYDYYKSDYDVKTTLPDGSVLINWYNDNAIDWDKFNGDIDNFKKKGLVVVGVSLPEDKIKSEVDYHIHLKISKLNCIERRKKYLEMNKDEHKEEFKLIDTTTEKLKMNLLVFPYYLEATKNSKINKFLNINELNDEQIYEDVFDSLINFIQKYLNQRIYEKTTTPKVSDVTTKKGHNQTDNISVSVQLNESPEYLFEKENKENLNMVERYWDQDQIQDGPIQFISLTD